MTDEPREFPVQAVLVGSAAAVYPLDATIRAAIESAGGFPLGEDSGIRYLLRVDGFAVGPRSDVSSLVALSPEALPKLIGQLVAMVPETETAALLIEATEVEIETRRSSTLITPKFADEFDDE